jgi:hypothetical protein
MQKKGRPLPGLDYIEIPLLEYFLRSASQTHPDLSRLKHAPPQVPKKYSSFGSVKMGFKNQKH